MLLAALTGGIIGLERQFSGHEAGIRTYAAVCLGSCLFGILSMMCQDDSRISAQIVSGIGFLGGGVIIRDAGGIRGLTTAATLWATASVGLAYGMGKNALGLVGGALIFLILLLHNLPIWRSIEKISLDHKDKAQLKQKSPKPE